MKNYSRKIVVVIFLVVLITSAISVSALITKSVDSENFYFSGLTCHSQGSFNAPIIQDKICSNDLKTKEPKLVCSAQGCVKPPSFDELKKQESGD